MKFLTLNTHAWQEENQELKLKQLAERIVQEDYDVICLQEVNQHQDSEFGIVGDTYCPVPNDKPIHRDNFALRLVDLLAVADRDYYWTWAYSHRSFKVYQEGLAILSKEPIIPSDFYAAKDISEITSGTRKIVTGITEVAGQNLKIVSCHFSWWEKGFQEQWPIAVEHLQAGEFPLVLMGDFNNPAGTSGYDLVVNSPLNIRDAYVAAESKKGEATVEGAINGWADNQEAIRIDYAFVDKQFSVKSCDVIFDGENGPQVSDHFGVAVELFQ